MYVFCMKVIDFKKVPVVVAVSGGFDPLHVGHVRLFEEARKLGDKLVVILNNDHWLRKKKGTVFMPQRDRNVQDAANHKSSLNADVELCKKLGITIMYNVGRGGKVQSSSWLLGKYLTKATKKQI